MMEQHEAGNAREQPHYNEVIVDTATYAANLPHSLEAVFYLADSDSDAVQHARAVHQGFLAEYPDQAGVPLLRLDMRALNAPFSNA